MADEVIRLLLDLGMSAEDAAKVSAELDRLGGSARKAADAYDVLERQVGEYEVVGHKAEATATSIIRTDELQIGSLRKLAIAENDATVALDHQVKKAMEATQAQNAIVRALDEFAPKAIVASAGATKLAGQGGKNGYGLMGASYAFQDFFAVLQNGGGIDRALMSVSNNTDQVARAMGASVANAAKLSLGFTAFTVALPGLIELFKQLWASMGGDGEKPKVVADALDAAEKKLAGIRGEVERILNATSPEEKDTEKLVKEFIETPEGRQAMGGLAQALGATNRGAQMTAHERAVMGMGEKEIRDAIELERVGAEGGAPAKTPNQVRAEIQAEKDAIQKGLNEANFNQAAELFGKAPTDRGARDTIRAMAQQFPGAFPKGFGGQLGELEPEALARQDREDEAFAGRMQAAHDAGVKRREQQKRAAEIGKKTERNMADLAREFQARQKLNQEVAALEETFGAEGVDRAEGPIRKDVSVGRRIGRAAAQAGEKAARESRVDPGGKLPLLSPGATDAQIDHALLSNQEQMTGNMAQLQQQLRRAQAIGQQNRQINQQMQQPLMNNGWN